MESAENLANFKSDSTLCNGTVQSPNFGRRSDAAEIDLIILHYTGMPDSESALNWLCDKTSQVSCHYFVFEDGRIVQLVRESDRAWHAGKSFWKGKTDINSCSIGIEIANPGHEHGYVRFPNVQIGSVVRLCKDICMRRKLGSGSILAHSDIAPDRKLDPGELFPWDALAKSGIGVWFPPIPIVEGRKLEQGNIGSEVEALQAVLRKYGFDLVIDGKFGSKTRLCVEAFQRKFRVQKIDGIADESTIQSLHKITNNEQI